MTSAPRSGLPAASERFYRQLLFLYPRAYRNEFGPKMARTFSDCCEIAFEEDGLGGLISLWPATLLDMTGTALEKHVEQGLLSSRLTAIRVICVGAMLGSMLMLAFQWDAENLNLLWASFLFTLGAAGLFTTSPWVIDSVKRRGTMSAANIQSTPGTRWPQARSIPWAMAALIGMGIFDLVDIVQDALGGAGYVQPQIERYGLVPAILAGTLPRLITYLLALWLYRRGSAWAVVPVVLLAVPRALFSSGVIAALVTGTIAAYDNPFGEGVIVLLAVATIVTGVWVVLELRKRRQTT